MFTSDLIEKLNQHSTPFYYYDLDLLERNLQTLQEASQAYGYKVHYALKANVDERILQRIREYGFGADCVSGNEVRKALEVGFPASDIVFAGVGKTDQEIQFAIRNNIHSLNCESLQELEVINALSQQMNRVAPVSLRLNPGLDARTHQYITTGLEGNKFGISQVELESILKNLHQFTHINIIGLHFHIGSQITDLEVFRELCQVVNAIQEKFAAYPLQLSHLNLGGGLGIDYYHPDENPIPDYHAFFQVFQESLKPLPQQTIHFELGRAVVAQCGALISRVTYVKRGLNTRFVILDAGMTELIRPALYHGYHKIQNLTSSEPSRVYDVVGPVCESADFFGKGVELPETRRGDLIAIRSVGAYGQVMASRYNLRDPARVIYSDQI
ncbi:MAG: diaminopimelate decarboxylase [Calditrichaeota bacterium]|nr:MAG: diaminopimelate decarboxylase [Calditrichota bacterium]